ncbi:MAG: 3-oxoacyl-[acyl-carrier protein] reductase [Cognaticolwellia sp.]|jgi:3-oxoacyl-[acyl-carrier protein] reductase
MNVIVLVTGATGGIGRATCFAYAKLGGTLFITARNQTSLDSLAKELFELHEINVYPIAVDITATDQITDLFKTIAQIEKRLDVLVHCAGVLTQQSLMMTRIGDIQADITTNLVSAIVFCQSASKLMMRNKKGVITLMSSIIAKQGSAGQSIYGASKAGIEGLVKSLAKELGVTGIRVNAIAPGFIETTMVEHFSDEDKASIANKTCLNRIGQVSDVVPLIQFLSSADAGYITGQIIAVDGGLVL